MPDTPFVSFAWAWLLIGFPVVLQTAPPPVATNVEYRLDPLPKDVKELDRLFTPPQIAWLEKLNRRDREHLPRPDPPVPGLVVPQAWPPNELDLSPLPLEYVWARAISKTVVVHQPVQAFGAYEFGRLVRWGPVSTGRKETPTPVGLFHLTWKAKERRSTDNDQWLLRWYFNFVNSRGVSFHQFDLPGYPASHACVRMLERDAEWLYSWGDQWKLDPDGRRILSTGSLVLIVGTPAAQPPWTEIESLASPVELPPLPIWMLVPVGFIGIWRK